MDIKKFTAPLQPHEIEWKIQSKTSTGKTIVVPYIDARAVYNRLDEAFGWEGWSLDIEPLEKGVVARLTINGATRADGSDYTKVEGFKGGISGAIKRVAHQFGLGRDLYDYPTVMIDADVKYLNNYLPQLRQITTSYLEGGKIVTEYINKGKPVIL